MPKGYPNKHIDSPDFDQTLPPLNVDDIGERTIEPSEVLRVNELELAAFMEEPVTIYVHPSNDANAPKIEYVGVEGRRQFIMRGETQVIRRKYVERLARARKTTFSQDLDRKDETLNVVYPQSANAIEFSVRKDTDRGHTWLDLIMREAA
jgi:hypothetical protein